MRCPNCKQIVVYNCGLDRYELYNFGRRICGYNIPDLTNALRMVGFFNASGVEVAADLAKIGVKRDQSGLWMDNQWQDHQ